MGTEQFFVRRGLVLFALAGWLVLGPTSARGDESPSKAGKPNILFILADDLGLDGVGCFGSDGMKNNTPHLDELAKSGLRFERCYCTPLCGPTRCELITGRYGFRTGGTTNQNANGPKAASEASIAKTLKSAGYATGMAGKWRQMGENPGEWGFDEWATDPTAGGWYWEKHYAANGKQVDAPDNTYMPDEMKRLAIDFMRRHKDQPWFFYFPVHLVHGPILRTPDAKGGGKEAAAGKQLSQHPLYPDNVRYMDKICGELVAEVEKLGLREKTLIVFSGDNGTAGSSATINGKQIFGHKAQLLEGGTHVPLIVSWKGTAPAGKVLNDLVDFTDFHTTFAELAGAKLPEGKTLDGHSIAPQIRGEKGTQREWVYSQLGVGWFVRGERFKLNQNGELFDLKDAPFAETPVAADSTDPEAKAAREKLTAVLDKLNPKQGKLEPVMPKKKKKQNQKA